MAVGAILSIAKAIIPGVTGIVNKLVKDKDLGQKLTHEIEVLILQGSAKELEAATKVIVAEAQSQSWMARNWRPMVMLMFASIIANNYIVYPYMMLFFETGVMLETPPDLWALMKIGLGGYVVGRSVEKAVKYYKNGGKD